MPRSTVLLADESRETRAMYREFLHHHGFRVVEAADGWSAVWLAREIHPDVIVLELKLPVLDGLSAIRMIRDVDQRTAILVCATMIEPVWPYSPPGAMVDSALPKPVSPRALMIEVQHLLARTHVPAGG